MNIVTDAVVLAFRTLGYTVSFREASRAVAERCFDVCVELVLNPEFGGSMIRSVPSIILFDDLRRMRTYFETYLAYCSDLTSRLTDEDLGAYEEDFRWCVPLNLGYQLKADSGEALADGAGDFGLLTLVNVGFAEDGTRVFAGADSTMTFAAVRRLIEDIERLIGP